MTQKNAIKIFEEKKVRTVWEVEPELILKNFSVLSSPSPLPRPSLSNYGLLK